jgi:(p)ppGpp synthase/HD superfamily hydrolase
MAVYTPERYVAALRFAAEHHRGQLVPGTELPYVVHVVSVAAEVIAALVPDRDADLAVCAALLHDTIEDTGATYAEIEAAFGRHVADGVQALSKANACADPMADSLRRIRMQPREISMVKLGDRITNLSPPPARWTRDKCREYRAEAIVIADALGSADATLDARLRTRIASYAAYC